MRRRLTSLLILFCFPLMSQSQAPAVPEPDTVIQLPSVPAGPGLEWRGSERSQVDNGSAKVSNVSEPSLTVYLPAADRATGTALVIAPGGGFHTLAIGHEGTDVAAWCVAHGIAAFVLKYRLVPTGENPGAEFMEKLQRGQERMDREMAPFIDLAKADGRAAIAYVREHAAEFSVSGDRIGIVGFSAGGTVAAAAGLEYASAAERPDFIAPIYAALHVVDLDTVPDLPMPLFLAVANDDGFGFQRQSIELYQSWSAAGQSVELHVYERGGHGFGMRRQNLPSDRWIDAFGSWLADHGWVE